MMSFVELVHEIELDPEDTIDVAFSKLLKVESARDAVMKQLGPALKPKLPEHNKIFVDALLSCMANLREIKDNQRCLEGCLKKTAKAYQRSEEKLVDCEAKLVETKTLLAEQEEEKQSLLNTNKKLRRMSHAALSGTPAPVASPAAATGGGQEVRKLMGKNEKLHDVLADLAQRGLVLNKMCRSIVERSKQVQDGQQRKLVCLEKQKMSSLAEAEVKLQHVMVKQQYLQAESDKYAKMVVCLQKGLKSYTAANSKTSRVMTQLAEAIRSRTIKSAAVSGAMMEHLETVLKNYLQLKSLNARQFKLITWLGQCKNEQVESYKMQNNHIQKTNRMLIERIRLVIKGQLTVAKNIETLKGVHKQRVNRAKEECQKSAEAHLARFYQATIVMNKSAQSRYRQVLQSYQNAVMAKDKADSTAISNLKGKLENIQLQKEHLESRIAGLDGIIVKGDAKRKGLKTALNDLILRQKNLIQFLRDESAIIHRVPKGLKEAISKSSRQSALNGMSSKLLLDRMREMIINFTLSFGKVRRELARLGSVRAERMKSLADRLSQLDMVSKNVINDNNRLLAFLQAETKANILLSKDLVRVKEVLTLKERTYQERQEQFRCKLDAIKSGISKCREVNNQLATKLDEKQRILGMAKETITRMVASETTTILAGQKALRRACLELEKGRKPVGTGCYLTVAKSLARLNEDLLGIEPGAQFVAQLSALRKEGEDLVADLHSHVIDEEPGLGDKQIISANLTRFNENYRDHIGKLCKLIGTLKSKEEKRKQAWNYVVELTRTSAKLHGNMSSLHSRQLEIFKTLNRTIDDQQRLLERKEIEIAALQSAKEEGIIDSESSKVKEIKGRLETCLAEKEALTEKYALITTKQSDILQHQLEVIRSSKDSLSVLAGDKTKAQDRFKDMVARHLERLKRMQQQLVVQKGIASKDKSIIKSQSDLIQKQSRAVETVKLELERCLSIRKSSIKTDQEVKRRILSLIQKCRTMLIKMTDDRKKYQESMIVTRSQIDAYEKDREALKLELKETKGIRRSSLKTDQEVQRSSLALVQRCHTLLIRLLDDRKKYKESLGASKSILDTYENDREALELELKETKSALMENSIVSKDFEESTKLIQDQRKLLLEASHVLVAVLRAPKKQPIDEDKLDLHRKILQMRQGMGACCESLKKRRSIDDYKMDQLRNQLEALAFMGRSIQANHRKLLESLRKAHKNENAADDVHVARTNVALTHRLGAFLELFREARQRERAERHSLNEKLQQLSLAIHTERTNSEEVVHRDRVHSIMKSSKELAERLQSAQAKIREMSKEQNSLKYSVILIRSVAEETLKREQQQREHEKLRRESAGLKERTILEGHLKMQIRTSELFGELKMTLSEKNERIQGLQASNSQLQNENRLIKTKLSDLHGAVLHANKNHHQVLRSLESEVSSLHRKNLAMKKVVEERCQAIRIAALTTKQNIGQSDGGDWEHLRMLRKGVAGLGKLRLDLEDLQQTLYQRKVEQTLHDDSKMEKEGLVKRMKEMTKAQQEFIEQIQVIKNSVQSSRQAQPSVNANEEELKARLAQRIQADRVLKDTMKQILVMVRARKNVTTDSNQGHDMAKLCRMTQFQQEQLDKLRTAMRQLLQSFQSKCCQLDRLKADRAILGIHLHQLTRSCQSLSNSLRSRPPPTVRTVPVEEVPGAVRRLIADLAGELAATQEELRQALGLVRVKLLEEQEREDGGLVDQEIAGLRSLRQAMPTTTA